MKIKQETYSSHKKFA